MQQNVLVVKKEPILFLIKKLVKVTVAKRDISQMKRIKFVSNVFLTVKVAILIILVKNVN